MSQLISDLNKSRIVGTLLKAQVANHVEVTDAHNNYHLATCEALTGISIPSPPTVPQILDEKVFKNTSQETTSVLKKTNLATKLSNSEAVISHNTSNTASAMLFGSSSQVVADPCSKNASRTLYLGNLLKKVTEQTLMESFSSFGHILDIEIKRASIPFAFIQFTNINSVVAAILSCQSNLPNSVGILLNNLQSPSSTNIMDEGTSTGTNFNGMLKLAKVFK